ncbi:hypothetical protein B0A48_08795 [Cryoendolithus antarcticus]|uniref:Uncharacterized protein n=1 Tax=Cryoendolithus antarcticus TaxID=1507870 RepID=A0A1V8T466_9PEZI|nr:hypothetical protein B0A48_08795 [Cryoendolithus antarcticus]
MDEDTLRNARQLAYESVFATREGGLAALKDRLRSWGGVTRTTNDIGNVVTTAIAEAPDRVTETANDAGAALTWADWLDGHDAPQHRSFATPTATAEAVGNSIQGLEIDRKAFLLWGGVFVTLYALVGFELQMGLPITNMLIRRVLGREYQLEWHGLGFWVPTLGEIMLWVLYSMARTVIGIWRAGRAIVMGGVSWTIWALMSMLVSPMVHYTGRLWARVTGETQRARLTLETNEDVTIARQRLRELRRSLPKYLFILALIGAALAFAWNSVVSNGAEEIDSPGFSVPAWHATADPDYRAYSLGSSSHYVGNMHQSVTWDEWVAEPVREAGRDSTWDVAPSDAETVTTTATITIERVVTPPPTGRPSVKTQSPISHKHDGEDCVNSMAYCHACKQRHWCDM